ncbi:YbaN family protein [Clostridium sp. Marseille-P299]|uniref:YbaN family protein n=1 Tax=Clostridium sp. Marseille-P299 TaxID=1805477 RepID=UPI00082BFE80|nr:YbaN family protein [Clostridium sp. Marseille-P299]
MKKKPLRLLYLLFAFVFLGIGAVGVIIPVLPTTPFLLLASYFFAKGSEKFHRWFMSTKLYKKHLESFVNNRAMTLKTKLSILLPVSAMLLITFYFVNNLHARIFIAAVIVFKYYYFTFHIKTIKENKEALDSLSE